MQNALEWEVHALAQNRVCSLCCERMAAAQRHIDSPVRLVPCCDNSGTGHDDCYGSSYRHAVLVHAFGVAAVHDTVTGNVFVLKVDNIGTVSDYCQADLATGSRTGSPLGPGARPKMVKIGGFPCARAPKKS
jgi:hypothetical protein